MKLVILGRDGQIGWELQRALVPLGEVVALSRAQADLEDTEALIGAVAAERPDILVNAAAYTAVDKAESEPGRADRINRAAVEALAGWAAASNCWLVHYSTDYVFDGRKTSPYVETDEDRAAERLRPQQARRRKGDPRFRLPAPDLSHQLGACAAQNQFRPHHTCAWQASGTSCGSLPINAARPPGRTSSPK